MTNHGKIVDFFENAVNVDAHNQFADELYDVIKASNQPSHNVMHALGIIAAHYLSQYRDPYKQLMSYTRVIESEMDQFLGAVST